MNVSYACEVVNILKWGSYICTNLKRNICQNFMWIELLYIDSGVCEDLLILGHVLFVLICFVLVIRFIGV